MFVFLSSKCSRDPSGLSSDTLEPLLKSLSQYSQQPHGPYTVLVIILCVAGENMLPENKFGVFSPTRH